MNQTYISRDLESKLRDIASQFSAITLTGPRQSGKTTILKRVFSDSHKYVSLDLTLNRTAAQNDPQGFLASYPPPVIIDEIQHAPELFFYIKDMIDERRDEPGLFILSGSQNFALLENITESLAGRTAILKLFPLSQNECLGIQTPSFPWERETGGPINPTVSSVDLWKKLMRGFYPELIAKPDIDQEVWHGSYIQTYIDRDVRSVKQIGDLTLFQSFIRVLAARSGQLLNLSDISRDLGIAFSTTKRWLSVLEASFIVIILRPYFINVGKRMVKSPKVYFTDTGNLCYLTGLKDPEHAASSPLSGAIIETAVVNEIYKRIHHRARVPQLYFWRTSHGTEVDIIIDNGHRLIPIEVKQSATPRPKMASSIQSIMKDFPDRIERGYVVHTGSGHLPLAPNIFALPFSEL